MTQSLLTGSVLAAAALVKYFFFTKRPVSKALRIRSRSGPRVFGTSVPPITRPCNMKWPIMLIFMDLLFSDNV